MSQPSKSIWLGDLWVAAFAKPSELWQPAPDLKPHEWTPLPVALERAKDRIGLDQAGFELQEHFATGRIKTALQHLYGTKMSRLFLQPPFWEPLEFRRGQGGFVRLEGTVAGLWLGGGSWAFFVSTANLDRHYPVTAPKQFQPQGGPQVKFAEELMLETFPHEEWRAMTPSAVRYACQNLAKKQKKPLPGRDSFARAMGRRR
jgi:hypothetical protein